MKIGQRLKELRSEKKLSQEDISNLTGISRTSIAMYECDERTPSLNNSYILARVYGVSIDYLCGATNIKKSIKESIEV